MIIGVFVFLPAANAEEISSEEAQMVSTASGALAQIMSISENAIPESLLQKAQAVAVIPNVIKAGFIVGGRYGKGVLVTREDDGTWSRPAFISLTGASVGWQLGAQSTDIVLVFTDKAALQGVEDGKLTLGAQASVAAGPVGRTAEVGTDVRLDSAVYSYSRSEGAFAGVALNGAVLNVDEEANANFYGTPGITLVQIFSSPPLPTPSNANLFTCMVARYSGTTQVC